LNQLLEKYDLEKLKPSIELWLRAEDSKPTWAIRLRATGFDAGF
jgi:hypothetical protein|tara:strand:+ start:77 stop:208 length:132 start_codon:yes stop_codon:yes gene_type:complete